MRAIKDVVAGTIGGITTVLVGHPLDTIKVRLQTNTEYSSMLQCVRATLAKEGLSGFYSGMSSPLAGEALFNAVQFLSYGTIETVSIISWKFKWRRVSREWTGSRIDNSRIFHSWCYNWNGLYLHRNSN